MNHMIDGDTGSDERSPFYNGHRIECPECFGEGCAECNQEGYIFLSRAARKQDHLDNLADEQD